MKFELHDFWKHENCLDAFIMVICIIQDTGEVAILKACWLTQGVESYWTSLDDQRIFIKRDQYDKWKRHQPLGRFI